MSILAERFPSLARHLSILRESWRRQNVADRSPVERSDHEFLPAALEIMERPPSPGMRMLLLSLCALFALAVIWSLVGRVDVIAVATGKTISSGNAKVVQSLQMGSVRAVHVRDGDFVRQGQLLVSLDPTLATADASLSDQSLLSAQTKRARNTALMAYLSGQAANFAPPAGTPADVVATQDRLVRTSIAAFEAERASLVQQRAQRAAELSASQFQIAKLQETLPYLDQQLEARRELAANGHFSKLKLLEFQQARVEHVRDIDVQRATAARALAATRDIDAQILKLRENFERLAATELDEASEKAGVAEQDVRKTQRIRSSMELRAPVDGIVQQVVVHTVGGVVQAAEPLMIIVPCPGGSSTEACRSAVEVEAYVLNRDVGFVRSGQKVAVKLEAFNFTDHGFIEGRIRSVSRDAVDLSGGAARQTQDSSKEAASPVYIAKIELDCGLRRNADLCRRASPGMAVQAEIRTGTRRIIDYLLSPLTRTVTEAARER